MVGTILFILAVAGFVFLIIKRNKKSKSNGGTSTGGTPPIIKDPNMDQPEEVN